MNNIKKVEKFNGNDKYLAILYRTEENDLYAAYALINKIEYQRTEDTYQCGNGHLKFTKKCVNEFVLDLKRDNYSMIIVKVRDEEEYKHIYSVVENLI